MVNIRRELDSSLGVESTTERKTDKELQNIVECSKQRKLVLSYDDEIFYDNTESDGISKKVKVDDQINTLNSVLVEKYVVVDYISEGDVETPMPFTIEENKDNIKVHDSTKLLPLYEMYIMLEESSIKKCWMLTNKAERAQAYLFSVVANVTDRYLQVSSEFDKDSDSVVDKITNRLLKDLNKKVMKITNENGFLVFLKNIKNVFSNRKSTIPFASNSLTYFHNGVCARPHMVQKAKNEGVLAVALCTITTGDVSEALNRLLKKLYWNLIGTKSDLGYVVVGKVEVGNVYDVNYHVIAMTTSEGDSRFNKAQGDARRILARQQMFKKLILKNYALLNSKHLLKLMQVAYE